MEPAVSHTVQESDTGLSAVLDEVESGHEIVIERAGRAVAKVIPLRPGLTLRTQVHGAGGSRSARISTRSMKKPPPHPR